MRLGTDWSDQEVVLYQAVLAAHAQSALRGNASHQALVLSAQGSGDYSKALIGALSTLGGSHAPLEATFDLLVSSNVLERADRMIADGGKVPGWGNAFVKGEADQLWREVECYLRLLDADMIEVIEAVTMLLHERGKDIYPNPSCWTCAAGKRLGFNRKTVGYLFVQGRLNEWTEAFREMMPHG